MKKTILNLVSVAVLCAASTLSAQSPLADQPLTSEEATALQLRTAAPVIRQVIVAHLQDASARLFQHSNPQGVLDELGTNGPVLAEMMGDLGAALLPVLVKYNDTEGAAKVSALLAALATLEETEGGTLIINLPEPAPEESPTPTPEP